MSYTITPIGTLSSPYKEKFAVPRQPGLVPEAIAEIHLEGDANTLESVRGLEQFSHLWLLFLFDQNLDGGWRPTVRPPRLGGNERIGVFASRATFRPNGIGLSSVTFQGVEQRNGQVIIKVGGIDLVDGTPIVDIKPYIPYSDAHPNAIGGFAQAEPETLSVQFSEDAKRTLATQDPNKRIVIEKVLGQDPRPAYKKGKTDEKIYGVQLFDWNVRFTVQNAGILVISLESGSFEKC